MKCLSFAAATLALVVPTLAYSEHYHLTSDSVFDKGDTLLSTTACGRGEFALHKYKDFVSIPSYPNIGSIPQIATKKRYCGTCWQLTYTRPDGSSIGLNVTAVDAEHDVNTFSISSAAFNYLTGGKQDSTVEIHAKRSHHSGCHLDSGY